MHLPYFLRRVNRVFTNPVNRVFTNPLMMTFAGVVPPLAIVHHVGRTSGKRYRTPVVAFESEKGFVIPMTYGRDVDWARNLVAAGGGEIERLGKREHFGKPRIVDSGTANKHLPALVRGPLGFADFPGYLLAEREAKATKPRR